MITNKEADILAHTSQNERYVTGPNDQEIVPLVESGLLRNNGTLSWLDGQIWLTLTTKGREALREWRSSQPKPKPLSKRKQRAKETWRRFRDWREAWGGSFSEFLKLKSREL